MTGQYIFCYIHHQPVDKFAQYHTHFDTDSMHFGQATLTALFASIASVLAQSATATTDLADLNSGSSVPLPSLTALAGKVGAELNDAIPTGRTRFRAKQAPKQCGTTVALGQACSASACWSV